MDKKSPLKQRSALGRGLSALLEDADGPAVENNESNPKPFSYVTDIAIAQIVPNPYQPRTDFDEEALAELAESIRVQGIIQPITVRKLNDSAFQLISGERRWQASKKIGLERIPAYIRTANDQQMLEMALIENIQRQDLNPLEVAFSYQRLISECSLKQEELGDRVGKKRSTVTNYLRLLKLPPDLQAALRDQQLSMGHAKALLGMDNIDTQLVLFKRAIAEEWSVRKTEEVVKATLEAANAPAPTPINKPVPPPFNPALKQLQTKISSFLGAKVAISDKGNEKGEININYQSTEDLNRILELLHLI
jgi:ParB family transcriptional regulator, chromosome partitioning protein